MTKSIVFFSLGMVSFALAIVSAKRPKDWLALIVLSALIYWPAKLLVAGTILGGDIITVRPGRGLWFAPTGATLIALGLSAVVLISAKHLFVAVFGKTAGG